MNEQSAITPFPPQTMAYYESLIPDRTEYADAVACGTADNIAFVRGDKLPELFRNDRQPGTDRPAGSVILHFGTCFLCVLDDLDKFPAGEWARAMFGLIDDRVWANRLPTIVTMNTTPAEFVRRYESVGPAIISRFKRAGGLFVRVLHGNRAADVIPKEGVQE